MSHGGRSRRGCAATAIRLWMLGMCLVVLASCTSTTSLPVSRREARAAVHVVQRGETLYKIAWQHRVDQQELASWNGIRNPDELRVGQRLRLVPPRGYVAAAPAPAARPPPEPVRQQPRATAPRPSTSSGPAAAPPAGSSAPRGATRAPAPAPP
ncbi:MAG: LysM peptidoglycan-binding domain-containing protein, partial [Lysobacterales bacterium]